MAGGLENHKPGFCKDALTPKALGAMVPLDSTPFVNSEAVRLANDYLPPETCDKRGNPIKRGRGKRSGALAKKQVLMQLAALSSKNRCTVNLSAAKCIVAKRLDLTPVTVERHIRALIEEGQVAIVEHPGAASAPSKAERALKLVQAAAYCKAKAESAAAPADRAPEPTAQSP